MATHSSILEYSGAWRVPWTEKPGRLQSMGLECIMHNSVLFMDFNSISFFKQKPLISY